MDRRVLVIEDELSIRKVLEYELSTAGFEVDMEGDGESGVRQALDGDYGVILLDVMLPGLDGFSVCRELRQAGIRSHVIMLSARDDEFDRVLGLDSGADDYMVKPFSSKEVVSKVKAVFRRRELDASVGVLKSGKRRVSYRNLVIDQDKFEVYVGDQLVEFTLKEYELLNFFVENKGRTLSRDVLLDELWGVSYYGETRVVDVHVFKLRDKLKMHGFVIKTVRGVGYILEDE